MTNETNLKRDMREVIFWLVFEYLFLKEYNELSLERFIKCKEYSEKEQARLKTEYSGIIENFQSLEDTVSSYSTGFSKDRIYRVDMAVLIVAGYELKYMKDIPHAVVISEAVELAKKYSTEKSCSFINGILSSFLKNLQ